MFSTPDCLLLAASANDYIPLVENDAVVFGMLMIILAVVFKTSRSKHPWLKRFYKWVPMLLMCYFLPSLLTLLHIVNPSRSSLYFVATRFLLPASLVLLTISVDLKEIFRLGPKALIMFLTGTVGVVLGGPIAILLVSIFNPDLVGGQGPAAVWRGMTTIAGSWIGGGANQLAMKEIFLSGENVNEDLFTVMVTIDVLVAETWMLFLLLGVGQSRAIDRIFRADASSIDRLQQKMESFSLSTARIPTTTDLMVLGAVAFGITGACHAFADVVCPALQGVYDSAQSAALASDQPNPWQWIVNFSLNKSFFWIVVLATTAAVGLSFTPVRNLEGAGASKIGTVFIFILVAVIGMQMDVTAVWQYKGLFLVGLIWMIFHVGLLLLVGYLIRAPYFFIAVGSKANIGGAASAPVVAAAFHPALAPVGVLLAVLGYALGTYCAYLCGLLMQGVAPT